MAGCPEELPELEGVRFLSFLGVFFSFLSLLGLLPRRASGSLSVSLAGNVAFDT